MHTASETVASPYQQVARVFLNFVRKNDWNRCMPVGYEHSEAQRAH